MHILACLERLNHTLAIRYISDNPVLCLSQVKLTHDVARISQHKVEHFFRLVLQVTAGIEDGLARG